MNITHENPACKSQMRLVLVLTALARPYSSLYVHEVSTTIIGGDSVNPAMILLSDIAICEPA